MNSADQTRKMFLLGTIGLVILIVIGLIWAVASGPGVNDGGEPIFNDENDPAFGPAESKVVVRVFGDFQCPACRVAEVGFQYAKKTYGDRVRFIWNDFPLQSIHPNAFSAANAARCAEAQGKFWEYHDRLYSEQPNWSEVTDLKNAFSSYAIGLGLNQADFERCYNDRTYQAKVNDDLNEGQRNTVNGTPTFFINNTRIVGIVENEVWDRELLSLLGEDATASSTTP